MNDEVGAVVVGAGVVGLAVARSLALTGRQVLVLEAEDQFGTATSSRNSEVIHAGLYYETGSLKARLCVEGADRLYRYCATNGVPHRQIGKVIFARDEAQLPELAKIAAAASAAHATGLEFLTPGQLTRIEPALQSAGALFSARTGIVDSHALMLSVLGEAEEHGAMLVSRTVVERIDRDGDMWAIRVAGHDGVAVKTPIVVNSAGLHAGMLASRTAGLDERHVPSIRYARGVYFSYAGRLPFSHLIYPTPEPGGLGTHLTFDLAGQARFGPDVEWIDEIDYSVDPARHSKFAAAARRIWSGIDDQRLVPAYAGIRAKLSGPGEKPADFVISGPRDHGCEGLVNLFGIESPGLTSSLAIADHVTSLVEGI